MLGGRNNMRDSNKSFETGKRRDRSMKILILMTDGRMRTRTMDARTILRIAEVASVLIQTMVN